LIADAVAGGETAFDGPFWDALRPAMVLAGVVANDVAVFLVGGWHDAFQRGAPLNYAALQNAFAGRPDEQPMQPGQSVSEAPRLMMGPGITSPTSAGCTCMRCSCAGSTTG
jgi:hypothetical protein